MSRVRLIFLVLLALGLLSASVTQAARSKRPDLVATAKAAPAQATPGAAVSLDLVVRNAGRRAARPSSAEAWLSPDARRGAGDVRLGAAALRGLRPGRSARAKVAVRIPAAARTGTQYLIACADAKRRVRESREANNCAAVRLEVRAPAGPARPDPAGVVAPSSPQPQGRPSSPAPASAAPPAPPAPGPDPAPGPGPAPAGDSADLAATDVSDPPASAREGTSFTVTDTTVNRGAAAGATTTRFYLAPDAAASLAERRASDADPRTALRDVLMEGGRDIGSVGAGATSTAGEPTPIRVPVGTAPGVYHLLACADDRARAPERDEGDNCAAATHPESGEERPTPIRILPEEQEYRLESASDVFETPDEAADESRLGALRDQFCTDFPTGSFQSVAAAVDSVKAKLTEQAGADAMAAFAASPEYGNAPALKRAAASAVVAQLPGAALAALVRAHELEPAKASHLIDAAAVATSVGMPAEALAMLDGARRLDGVERPAMGIGRHGTALANRGAALVALGRFDEADRALDAAVAADPLLTEALMSRSASTVCREGAKAAAKFLGASRKRSPAPLDLSQGRPSTMRDLPLPGFPKQAAGMRDFYRDLTARVNAEIGPHNDRERALNQRIAAKRSADWTPAQSKRTDGLFARIYRANREPSVKAKAEVLDEKLDAVKDVFEAYWVSDQHGTGRHKELSVQARADCQGSPEGENPCYARRFPELCRPALKLAHQAWVDEMQEAYDAGQAYFGALSTQISAHAVHLRDPDANAKALLVIEQREQSLYARLLQPASLWSHFVWPNREACVEEPDVTTDATAPGAAGPASEPPCWRKLKAMSGVFALGPTEFKVSCEEVQQSVKREVLPWLQAFGEVTFNHKQGRLTIVAGSQLEIPAAGVAKGAFKSGVYVTVDRTGSADVGWRVGPTVTVGSGAVEFELHKDEIDISFVEGVSSTFGQ